MDKKYSNKYVIETGIGLQDVDNLKNSTYFLAESEKCIRGEISLSELEEIVTSYYKTKKEETTRSEEADLIAVRIAKIISDDSFSFTVGQLVSIHKELFLDVFAHAGKLRTYNFIKKESVLDGASVWYGDYRQLETSLQVNFELERRFDYSSLSMDEIINHLADFISNLWQIHAFEEGNTRTTAVFIIKYLRHLGFNVTNDTFAKNAWYFRNSLVRANYINLRKGVYADYSFLTKFLRNLLLNEKNELNNKELNISAISNDKKETRETRVIKMIKDNPKITIQEIADNLGVSLRTAKNIIAALKKGNLVKREKSKKSGYWVIL